MLIWDLEGGWVRRIACRCWEGIGVGETVRGDSDAGGSRRCSGCGLSSYGRGTKVELVGCYSVPFTVPRSECSLTRMQLIAVLTIRRQKEGLSLNAVLYYIVIWVRKGIPVDRRGSTYVDMRECTCC